MTKEEKPAPKIDANDLSQKKTVVAEQIGKVYGKPNPKPSKYEKKLRNIFTEMS